MPDATSFFPVGGCLPQAAFIERLLSEKSGRCGIRADWRSVALYLWLIVVISVVRLTVAAISGLHCRALVVGQFEQADSLIAKFKEAGGTVREIDGDKSHRDYLRSGYLHHRPVSHGLLIITVITPLPTKSPRERKMPENWSWRTSTCRCVSVRCCCAWCK